jgi:hypothetical protein
MSAFRLFDPFQTFFDLEGKLAAGGSLVFYQAGTTTPADVYGDSALATNNGSTIAIGTDGRPVDDIWGNISYRARLYDALGTLVSDRDNLQIPGGTGLAIPALVDGNFLTNDGSVLAWDPVEQLPDPTGASGKILGTDGVNFIWQAPPATPAVPDPDILVGATSIRAGVSTNTSKFLILTGSDSAAASGTSSTSKAVTFAQSFTTLLGVQTSITGTSYNSVGFFAAPAVTGKSTAGFTFNAQISAHQGGSGSDANINSAVPFDWIAYGLVTVTP